MGFRKVNRHDPFVEKCNNQYNNFVEKCNFDIDFLLYLCYNVVEDV